MGCFLGCFSGAKEHGRRKHRHNRASSRTQLQRNRVQNVHQESLIAAEQIITETHPISDADSESQCRSKPEGEEPRLSPSPRKRVTFDSNITTFEHVSLHESVDSLPECNRNVEKEKKEDTKISSMSCSLSDDDNSVISSSGSFPQNHRYHNSRESDDEFEEEYGDSDLDYDDDDYDEDIDVGIASQVVWCESLLTLSVDSQPSDEKVRVLGSKPNSRDRSDYVNSVLHPVENINQWKTVKSKATIQLKPLKENLTANFEPPRVSFSCEPSSFKSKSGQLKNQEIAVVASLSNWLVSPEKPSKTITSGKTVSEGSVKSFEDRPILGAWTVDELRQISVSPSPRKSPSRSPDEMPIIGTVGTYWNHSGSSAKNSDSAFSYKGIPNTTSKYREDKRVNWHSTPFETRLDRALNNRAAEA